MPDRPIPRAQAPLTDKAGLPSREWYTYFLGLSAAAGGDPEVAGELRKILVRLQALEQTSPVSFNVVGLASIDVSGSPQNGYVRVALDGDADQPGGNMYYGTDAAGAKGWSPLMLAALADVDLTGLTNGDTLVWDAAAQRFTVGAAPSGQSFTRITATGDIRVTAGGNLRITP